MYTTRSSYYSHRRKRHPKLPRVEDIYRRAQKIHSGIANKHNTDKSQSTKEGAGGRVGKRVGGSTGAKSSVINETDIVAKNVVNIKRKGNAIENITVKLSNTKENKRARKTTVKSDGNHEEGDLDKLKEVAGIVHNLKTSPKAKSQKSPESKVKKQSKVAENTKKKGSIKVKLKQPEEKAKRAKSKGREKKNKESKETKRKKSTTVSSPKKVSKLDSVTESLVKKKTQGRKKKGAITNEDQKETDSNTATQSVPNTAGPKANRRKSKSPKKSTGPRFSPLAIPIPNDEPVTDVSPGSEERSLVQVAPVLSMKAYDNEGRPIHVKFVPVLAQTEGGEGTSSLSTEEVCESIQKQALDIAARVKDELVSSGVRVSSTSTEKSVYLGQRLIQGQSPRAKEVNISPLISCGVLNNNSGNGRSTQEENNNEVNSSEPLDLSISSSNNKNRKTELSSSDFDYDPENVINITPIEYPSGRKSKSDDWVVPERDFRKRGRPPKPMKQKVISLADPSRVISSMVINVDLQQQSQNAESNIEADSTTPATPLASAKKRKH